LKSVHQSAKAELAAYEVGTDITEIGRRVHGFWKVSSRILEAVCITHSGGVMVRGARRCAVFRCVVLPVAWLGGYQFVTLQTEP